MKKSWMNLSIILVLISMCGVVLAAPQHRFSFEGSNEGWASITSLPDSENSSRMEASLALTNEPSDVKVGKSSLKAHYRIEEKKMAGIIRPVDGLNARGIRVWLKTDSPTTLVMGFVERDGSAYMRIVQTSPNKWEFVESPFTSFTLSDDSSDENNGLDPDQVGSLLIVDAGGFLPGAGIERTLWVDEYEVTNDIKVPMPKPYLPLLDTGHPSDTGARASAGITYPSGKFGQGILANASGELAAVPIKWPDVQGKRLNWDQGTIEMWISPQFNMDQVRDYCGLVAMHDEPFTEGFKGSLLVFYTKTHQIAFTLNSKTENIVYTLPLSWKAGEWHHIAVTWGDRGMHLYSDGKLITKNQITGGPIILSGDIVVGSQAWTVMADRYANTIIDELRLSKRQLTDAEISADARSTTQLKRDKDTLALEHFDGIPLQPILIKRGALPFNAVIEGKPVSMQVAGPVTPASNLRLSYTISTPSGSTVRTCSIAVKPVLNAGKGVINTSISLKPFVDPGFYRIKFKLQSGDKVINEGTDWFRVRPAVSSAASNLLFGASACNAQFPDGENFFKYASTTGVRSIRVSFEWAEIEPAEGKFVWDKYDHIVQWANKHNVELIPTFIWERPQPAWAGEGVQNAGLSEERYPPTDIAKWSEFVYQVVNRYKGRIHWWIPANEPNLSRYWHPKPDAKAYVELLKATRTAVLRADPGAKILGCSAAGIDLGFLEACFKEGALDYCDAVGIHPYICPNNPDSRFPINILDPASAVGTFSEGISYAKALIAKYGGKQNLWLDEAGQPYRNDFMAINWGVSEATAAEYMLKIYLESAASGSVDRVLWFSFLGGDYGSFALLKPDRTPSLPAIAYTAAVEKLGDLRFTGQGTRGEGVRSLIFSNGSRTLEVIWSPDGKREVTLESNEHLSDIYGFPITRTGINQKYTLTSQPVYVERIGK
ncbi:MAG: LamG-like jellyroll fold domain-containing protein [Armatimonadota bacterium]